MDRERLLLIDTCGETAGVAVCANGAVLGMEEFAAGRASAEIVTAVRRLLDEAHWTMADLDAVGVVSGPGSFTGVRTGLAAAKGFCEGAGVRLVPVSRLSVLAHATDSQEGFVALDAGRFELYVLDVATGREWLCGDTEIAELDGKLVVASQRVAERLTALDMSVRALHVSDALAVVRQQLTKPRLQDAVNANYVRGEQDIYRTAGEPARSMPRFDK